MLREVVEKALEKTQGAKGKILENALKEARVKYIKSDILRVPSRAAWDQVSKLLSLSVSALENATADLVSAGIETVIVDTCWTRLFIKNVTEIEIAT